MEHLATMERVLEVRIPSDMSLRLPRRVADKGVAFDASGRLSWPGHARSRSVVRKVRCLPTLRELVLERHRAFLAVLSGLLEMKASARLSPEAACAMPFLRMVEVAE
mmetsp:Transcript_61003/g.142102  ORF Transcript_61003/g.142102 Transcript_61003/m.142102 type:complete len:107 (+) Transcript_61003:1-321(+)